MVPKHSDGAWRPLGNSARAAEPGGFQARPRSVRLSRITGTSPTATMVLRPFNSDTLAVVAYQLARDERLGEAALPSLALVAVGLVPVILLSRTLRSRT